MIHFSNVGKESDKDTEKIEFYCIYDHKKREFRPRPGYFLSLKPASIAGLAFQVAKWVPKIISDGLQIDLSLPSLSKPGLQEPFC